LFVLCCLIPVGAAVAVARASSPAYDSTAQLYLASRDASSAPNAYQDALLAQQQAPSLAQLVNSPAVMRAVIADLHLATSPSLLATRVSATSPTNSVLINVTARGSSPAATRDIANVTAARLAAMAQRLAAPTRGGHPAVKIILAKPAVLPTAPSSAHTKTDLALGLVVGLVLAFSVVILREKADGRVRTAAQAQTGTGCRLVAVIEQARGRAVRWRHAGAEADSPAAESFRRLRLRLAPATAVHHARSLAVTSLVPGDPGPAIAANLALVLAEDGSTVALVDTDPRSARIVDYFGVDGSVGVTTVIRGLTPLEAAVQRYNEHLLVLPAGPAEAASRQATQAEVSDLVGLLERSVDHVVVHAGPVLAHASAAEVCAAAHTVVLATRKDQARQEELRLAAEILGSAGADLVGVVLAPARLAPMTSAFEVGGPVPPATPAANGAGRGARTFAPASAQLAEPRPSNSKGA
jgi:capsular polysaccharide biosynthesis protein